MFPKKIAEAIALIRIFESPSPDRPELAATSQALAEIETKDVMVVLKAMQQEVRQAWGWPTPYDRFFAFLLAAARYIFALAAGLTESAGKTDWGPSEWAAFGVANIENPLEFLRKFEMPAELSEDAYIHILLHAMNSVERMRVCPNEACPASFFFARKRNQRYCCDRCAAPSQREFKRRWWQDHGEEWRAKRAKKQKSKRGSRQSQRKRGK